ncbi:hypothetical protein SKAU_G00133880 [Synaphobranchus kaupii]|uniref:2',3'-cyclic-nucleotide 3'-phosphodiesterase n=1 Tax=Synaphobranchus kaupii TaxID=118154 RepID=A0A9Q1FRZ0_SYNKA|nr:hypothetical protein SKAU_G00133880 [Synaphobranchus kaupii]
MLESETQKPFELELDNQPEPVKQPEVEKQLELDTLAEMKPDTENQLESDSTQQPEESPVKQPELSPVKEPELSPVKEPELSPVKEPELSPLKEQPELSPVKEKPELSPVKEQPELSPVKQQPELSPVKQQPELSPVKQQQPELSPVKQQQPELSPVKQQQPELSPVKQQQPELSPVKQQQPELSPVKQQQPELSPVKQQQPELSPVKQQQPELSPVKQQQPELSPVKQQQPELSPVKQQQPELSPVKQQQPELSPVKQQQPELSPVKQQQPELSPVKQQQPELSPVKQQQPELSPVKQQQPELSPVKQSPVKQPEVSPVKLPEPEPEKNAANAPEPEKQTEPENQPDPEEPEAKEKLEPAVPAKQTEIESGKLTETEAKLEAESEKNPEAEQEKCEERPLGIQEEQEQQASEVETPAPIVPGSLAFAILEEEHTKTALCTSHTLIIIRGLPGSGKTRLANAIRDHYQSFCTIVSADDYNVKPENLSVEGHKAMDEAVVASCTSGTAVVVVDDTNHMHSRLARLVELAEQHQYYTLFLEPRTEWGQDVEQLVQKTQRGLEKSQIQALKGPLEETSLPLFFGWFLCPSFQEKLRSMAKDFLKTLQGLEAFKKHLSDFTGEAEKEVDLEQHFQDKGMLHCTTKLCDYGKAEGSKEYAEQQAVKDRYGSMSELKLSALFLTPRTLGARVSLTEDQLQLWPADAEKEAMPDADLPPGSRAHVTLGCAEGVEPVQTGLDLLELVLLQQQGQEGEQVQDLDLGPLAYYGKGMWVLSLHESSLAPACFCSYYGPKKEDGKKEAEKKKKFKCNLQ